MAQLTGTSSTPPEPAPAGAAVQAEPVGLVGAMLVTALGAAFVDLLAWRGWRPCP